MDAQTLFNVGSMALLTIIGWFLNAQRAKQNAVDDKVAAQEKELTNFRIEVAKDYVTTHDLADIKNSLVRIETKIDAKADK